MCFINHSAIWLQEFDLLDKTIIGKSFYKVMQPTPNELKNIYEECLKGLSSSNNGRKFIFPNGLVKWLKWKINPWKYEDGSIGGLIIVQEDITKEKRRIELLQIAESVARIGGWDVDLVTNQVFWTKVTKEIHEVPSDYVPSIEEGINFYKEGKHRKSIRKLVEDSILNGTSWDTELIIVTAKGKELWVRAKGEAEMLNGKCIRLQGTFQDIDKRKKAELKSKMISDRLAIATKGANVGIWDFDIQKNELVWDDNMYNLYGIDKKDFDGVYQAWQSGLHPEDKERGDREIAMAISGEKEFDTEFRVVWPTGEIRHIKAYAVTQRDKEGKAIKMTGTNWDITELKRTRLKLEKIEESFTDTFKNSAIGMALVGLDGKILKANKMLCESLDYSEKEILSLAFKDITYAEDLDKDALLLKEVIDGKRESFRVEKRYLHKNGDLIHAILTLTVVKTIEGKPSHFIAQVLDITSRIKAESKHKEISERLNMATSVANIGIWDYRIKENVVLCNENMYAMYGISEDSSDILNEWMNRIHPEDRERVSQELELTITEEKPFNIQFRGIRPDGNIVHLIAFGEAQKGIEGDIENIIGANWDITELKTTRLKLERSQESFEKTFENSAVGMALVGLDGSWVSVNKGLCNSLGYTQDELLKLTFQDITHPDDLDLDLKLLRQVIKGEISTYQIEKRYFHKDGNLVSAILTVTAVKDIQGNLSHFISQILDISSRIQAEKRTKKLLLVTKEQNESLLNFAHIVSHNLRSHSSNLSMLTGFLSSEKDDTERENLLAMLHNASESLGETVMHLNEVVQVKVGASEKVKKVNIFKTLKNVEKNLSILLKDKNAICTIEIPKELKIKGIPAYFDSIFLNLLSNSIKYSSPKRQLVIKVSAVENDSLTTISFEDNGLGIDLERHAKKLFGMYKTFHRHKDAKGIGLFITKNQIEAMNGTIEVESTVDVGTKFLLTFDSSQNS